jgi:uncharacterized protein
MVKRKKKTRKIKRKKLFLLLVIFLIIGYIAGIGSSFFTKLGSEKIEPVEVTKVVLPEQATKSYVNVPAVDNNGNGVVTTLEVIAMPGSGRTLVDIDNLLFWADTQNSIRMAKLVAKNITGLETDDYDIIYNIKANASLIGGPSAGAALTLVTISALENKPLKQDVMLTGGINHDGTISPVSGILEKAEAAKDLNATIFLVPLLQSREVVYERREHCEKFGFTEICNIEQVPKKINIEDKVDIKVREIENIKEALEYFY